MCLGAAVALISLSWPLTHRDPEKVAESAFRAEFQAYARDEQRIVAAQNALLQLEVTQQIDRQEWSRRMQVDILPRWQAAEARLASVQLAPDSLLGRLQARMIEYLDEKRSGLTLLSEAERRKDPAKIREAEATLARNEAHERELAQLMRQVY
jgi:hypothetical protein